MTKNNADSLPELLARTAEHFDGLADLARLMALAMKGPEVPPIKPPIEPPVEGPWGSYPPGVPIDARNQDDLYIGFDTPTEWIVAAGQNGASLKNIKRAFLQNINAAGPHDALTGKGGEELEVFLSILGDVESVQINDCSFSGFARLFGGSIPRFRIANSTITNWSHYALLNGTTCDVHFEGNVFRQEPGATYDPIIREDGSKVFSCGTRIAHNKPFYSVNNVYESSGGKLNPALRSNVGGLAESMTSSWLDVFIGGWCAMHHGDGSGGSPGTFLGQTRFTQSAYVGRSGETSYGLVNRHGGAVFNRQVIIIVDGFRPEGNQPFRAIKLHGENDPVDPENARAWISFNDLLVVDARTRRRNPVELLQVEDWPDLDVTFNNVMFCGMGESYDIADAKTVAALDAAMICEEYTGKRLDDLIAMGLKDTIAREKAQQGNA